MEVYYFSLLAVMRPCSVSKQRNRYNTSLCPLGSIALQQIKTVCTTNLRHPVPSIGKDELDGIRKALAGTKGSCDWPTET